MISFENQLILEFVNIGLFDTRTEWIHPTITCDTVELIYVLAGKVNLFEGEKTVCAKAGELLRLDPHLLHGGTQKREGHTSFYWLHFRTNDVSAWEIPKLGQAPRDTEKAMREMMHLWQTDRHLTELTLATFLLESKHANEYKSRLAYEIREYLRLHAALPLRVSDVAAHFGYSADHLSRVYRKEFGQDLKEGITRHRLALSQSLLVNTDYSIKEIALMSGFEDENAFVKFFKYHEKLTPTMYRNRFFHIHMNNK